MYLLYNPFFQIDCCDRGSISGCLVQRESSPSGSVLHATLTLVTVRPSGGGGTLGREQWEAGAAVVVVVMVEPDTPFM